MNDEQKSSLVQALMKFHNEANKEGTIGHGIACLETAVKDIDRLLAAQSTDALLDLLPDHIQITFDGTEGARGIAVVWPAGGDEKGNVEWRRTVGTGATRMDAIRNAVAQATGTTQEGASDE